MAAAPTASRTTPATRQHTVLDSPYGPLTLVATDGVWQVCT